MVASTLFGPGPTPFLKDHLELNASSSFQPLSHLTAHFFPDYRQTPIWPSVTSRSCTSRAQSSHNGEVIVRHRGPARLPAVVRV